MHAPVTCIHPPQHTHTLSVNYFSSSFVQKASPAMKFCLLGRPSSFPTSLPGAAAAFGSPAGPPSTSNPQASRQLLCEEGALPESGQALPVVSIT